MLSKMIHKYTTTIEYLHIPRTRTNAPKQGGLCGFIGVVKNLYKLLHFKYLLSYLKKSKNLKNLIFRSIARSQTGDQIMRLIMTCSELYAIVGFQRNKVSCFGNSVTKIYTAQEDYKPVLICVHCCQIPIYYLLILFLILSDVSMIII